MDHSFSQAVAAAVPTVALTPQTQKLAFEQALLAVDYVAAPAGDAQGLLLLVNGYGRHRSDFRAFRKRIGALMPALATVSLDNRGSGETENASTAFDVARLARDARFVADVFARRLGLSGFSALGVSMGGMICQSLATDHSTPRDPVQLRKLILVSSTAGGVGRIWPERFDDARHLVYRPWPTDEAGMRQRMERYFGSRFQASAPLIIDTMIKNLLRSTAGAEANARSAQQFHASAGFDGAEGLSGIEVPTLVVSGEEDAIIPHENALYLYKHLPQAALVSYPGVGHLILVEEPEKFVADVARFLQA